MAAPTAIFSLVDHGKEVRSPAPMGEIKFNPHFYYMPNLKGTAIRDTIKFMIIIVENVEKLIQYHNKLAIFASNVNEALLPKNFFLLCDKA